MTLKEVLKELQAAGTAQNRKVYARHGVGGKMYGVSCSATQKLKKRIKTDQTLADGLWATGNHDARILATMVADPSAMTKRKLDTWAGDLDSYPLGDAFGGLVGHGPHALAKMEKWVKSKGEWTGQVGWRLVAYLAMNDDGLPDTFFKKHLEVIEKDIHTRKNRVRHAMNLALIAIGIRNKAMQKAAEAAAGRIGKVHVDHGETGCKTPDAVAYIRKTLDYRKNKKK